MARGIDYAKNTLKFAPTENPCIKCKHCGGDEEFFSAEEREEKNVDSFDYVIGQIKWERDRAMEQLEANGLRFGHRDDYGWIPCSERLPEEKMFCLATIQFDDGTCYMDLTLYLGHNIWRNSGTVIAWMPLPEPWKETKDGEKE